MPPLLRRLSRNEPQIILHAIGVGTNSSGTIFLAIDPQPTLTATLDGESPSLLNKPALAGTFNMRVAMKELPNVITASQAARIVGLSESTLAKLRLNGNGPVYCKLGRRVVYRPKDLEAWLESRTTRDTSDADARFLKALTSAHAR
jgi:predicted DNA-binding transcriptional regulator AlpA